MNIGDGVPTVVHSESSEEPTVSSTEPGQESDLGKAGNAGVDLLCTPSTQSRILRASIEVQQDVAPPVIEVPESPPPVAVCRAAEEVANLEDVTIMEQAPARQEKPNSLFLRNDC